MGLISAQERDSVDFLLQEEGLEPYRVRPMASRGKQVMWAPCPGLDPMEGSHCSGPTFLTCQVPGSLLRFPHAPLRGQRVSMSGKSRGQTDPAQGTQ